MSAITVTLSPEIMDRLRTTGISTYRASKLLGVRPSQSARLLKRAGAVESKGMWRMGR